MKTISIEIKWAIIFIIMSFLWMIIERLVGLHDQHLDKHQFYSIFFAIPAIAIYVFALIDKRKNYYGGLMTYKQGLISGLIITGILTLLAPLTQYIISEVITPHYFNNVISYVVEHKTMTLVKAEDYFNLKNYMIQNLIGTSVMGIVTSAVVALFVKSKAKRLEGEINR